MQKTFFEKQKKVFIMLKFLIISLILSSGIGATVSAQDNKTEELRDYLDSLKAAHVARAELMKKEMMERIAAFRESMQSSQDSTNVVTINGKVYVAKDSLFIKHGEGTDVQVSGNANVVTIESKEGNNTVIVSQSGNGNKASISQKQPKKEDDINYY
jgi:uncharacterized protein YgiM (DUF1202 family)